MDGDDGGNVRTGSGADGAKEDRDVEGDEGKMPKACVGDERCLTALGRLEVEMRSWRE